MLLYHGTKTNFETFDTAKLGLNYNDQASKTGFFFATSKEEAKQFGNIVKTVNVNLSKIFTIDDEVISNYVTEWLYELEDSDPEEHAFQVSTKQYENSKEIKKGVELAIVDANGMGYDGVKVIDEEFGQDWYVVFNPKNIEITC